MVPREQPTEDGGLRGDQVPRRALCRLKFERERERGSSHLGARRWAEPVPDVVISWNPDRV